VDQQRRIEAITVQLVIIYRGSNEGEIEEEMKNELRREIKNKGRKRNIDLYPNHKTTFVKIKKKSGFT
jgi:hypothetical protein